MLHGSTPPPTYAWAGFISATTRLTSTMSDMLTLKVVTRVVGYGKPEVLPQAGREYDDYLTCKGTRFFESPPPAPFSPLSGSRRRARGGARTARISSCQHR